MSSPEITKAALIHIIQQWQKSAISAEALQIWMIDHYDPPETPVGTKEPECVQEAMHVVMNEYEIADIECYVSDKADLALALINCDDSNFIQARSNFLKHAFTD